MASVTCPHEEPGKPCPHRQFIPCERNAMYIRPAIAYCNKKPVCGKPDWPPGHNA